MNLFVILSFALLGILAFVIQKKGRFEQIDILHLLFVAAIAILLKSDFQDENLANTWSYSLIFVLAINFLLSRWSKLRSPFIRLIPPLISFSVLLAIYWNDSFSYLGENFDISNKATFLLPIMGIVMYDFARMKLKFLKKIFGLDETIVHSIMPFLIGLTALIGAFNAQGYGVFLVGTGFLAASFYNPIGSKHILHSILGLSLIWMFAAENSIELIDLRFAKVIGGLFVGAFIGGFLLRMWSVEKKKNVALLLTYFLCVFLLVMLLVVGAKVYESFGGVEAFLGALVGFALTNSVLYAKKGDQEVNQSSVTMSALVLFILIGLIIPPLLVNEEALEVQKTLESIAPKNEEGEEIEVAYISFEGLTGKHEIIQESSIISFKLGPDGSVTKGAIKEFSGSFNFTEELSNSNFNIELPVLNLTTFIPTRDKSIMGAEYFNQKKFPLMKFSGSKLIGGTEENSYEMIGSFEMLGTKKEEKVLVQRIEEEGKIVLVGSGDIDRRDYGMLDDPREGNIVSFEFKVELK